MKRLFKYYTFINVLFVVFFSQILHAQINHVYISEIMYDSPLQEDKYVSPNEHNNGEYIKLYNPTFWDVDISGWTLTGSGSSEQYTFPLGTVIPAGRPLLITYKSGNDFNFASFYHIPDNNIIRQSSIILHNKGESLFLYDGDANLKDMVSYTGNRYQSVQKVLFAKNRPEATYKSIRSLHRTRVEYVDGQVICSGNQDLTFDLAKPRTVGYAVAINPPYIEPGDPGVGIDWGRIVGENYVATSMPKVPKELSVPGQVDEITSVDYFDGLGRYVQSVQRGITPEKDDLVNYQEYDKQGRNDNLWLTRVANNNYGKFVKLNDFMNLSTEIYQGDLMVYSKTVYEPSSLNRITKQYGPGSAWFNKRTEISYDSNDDNIAYFFVNNNSNLQRGDNYIGGMLYKTTLTDEDGKNVTIYNDKLDRKILERKANNVDTYYVYNDLGQLSYVIPPIAADSLPNTPGQINDDDGVLKRYAYLYKYDERGNQIYKRLPGCEPVLMVYDKANRLILSQDGNQKSRMQWFVCKYDMLGRLLYTGITENSSSHEDLIEDLRDEIITESWNTDSNIDNTGYTCGRFTLEKLLTVNYYDNYNFVTLTDTNLDYDTGKENEYGYQHSSAKGLVTGTRTYLLDGSNNYTATAQYYDYKGQVIQSRSSNHLGGHDYAYNQYNFTGNVTKTLKEHNIAGQPTVTELYTYTYDHALRPATVNYTLNSNDPVLLAANKYDELGRLIEKKRHGNIDIEQFEYNIRGWTTKIKSGDFEQNLYYNTGLPQGATACYNGNMAYTTWKYNGLNKGYIFSYDNLNRLTSGVNTDANHQYEGYNSEGFSYDKQGNISSLWRTGNNGDMDNLYFGYNGNQIQWIFDDAGSWNLYNLKEYTERHNSQDNPETEFFYDSNGNMTTDLDRDIVTIKYNLLNLPDTIQFKSGHQILNTYDAGGHKLRSKYFTLTDEVNVPIGSICPWSEYWDSEYGDWKDIVYTSTSYVGNHEYLESFGQIYNRRIHNSEGYIVPDSRGNYIYHYYRKDHLGNNREVWRAAFTYNDSVHSSSTVQRTQYYPSGLPWKSNSGDNPGEQPYKYGEKEFVEMHGWNAYDSRARWYFPDYVRTPTPDPHAENYYDTSPYAWCGNNFVNRVDPTGMDWYIKEDGFLDWSMDETVLNYARDDARYIGLTANGIDAGGNFIYGDQFGGTHDSAPLREIEITANMPDHIRDIRAGLEMGIYQAHEEFLTHPFTQVTVGLLSLMFAPEFVVAQTVAPSISASFYASNIAGKGVSVALNVAKGGQTIIGEGMKRVSMEAAKRPGSVILNNMPKFTGTADQVTSQMMTYNRQWILQQMRSGRLILDIGLDATRVNPSMFYQMEQNMMKNYLKLHPNAFQIIKP